MNQFSTLNVDRAPDRMVVTLDRPAVRNAIDQAMIIELHAVRDQLDADPKPLLLNGSAGHLGKGALTAAVDRVMARLTATLGERFSPPQLLQDRVARGEVGRRTGQGFFSW